MSIVLESIRVSHPAAQGGERIVLDIPRFMVEDGRQVCLVGSSGSGKTTLLNIIAGIVRPHRGTVRHGDVDLFALPEAARDRFRAAHVGYVFQTFNLLQGLTGLENVMVAASFAGHSRDEARRRATELLARVGLQDRQDAKPSALSVGEQQRVALARAVVNRPQVVLADEPTANLDEENGAAVLDLLREVTAEEGSILILVTHDAATRARFEDVLSLAELGR